MHYLKIKTAALALLTLCFAACNNDSSDSSPEVSPTDSTTTAPSDSATSSMSDTAMHKMNDTSVNKKSNTVTSSVKKKKLKA